MSNVSARFPIITVVGATGTGKSELAVNIAREYNGEVINGDAMQLYEGLPIITNKISDEERKGVPHHLLGCIDLDKETWTVSDFVTNALKTIGEIRSRGRLPVLVGGTHYYTQSLLFHEALTDKPQIEESTKTPERHPFLDSPTEVILEKLREVDPVMADRWHPNDRRKIQRSLEIWLQTGRKASEIYEEQRTRRGNSGQVELSEDSTLASLLRMRTLVLWVNAKPEVLSERLDNRVDKMINHGLLKEVEKLSEFSEQKTSAGQSIDMTRGIWVAIGYKEFLEYQAAVLKGDSNPAQLSKLLEQSIEKTKAGTRQYAKRQIRWIRIKLSHAINTAGAKNCFFMLDGSNLSTWEQDVSKTGLELVDAFLKDQELPDPLGLSPFAEEMLTSKKQDISSRTDLWCRNHCEACNMTAITERDWTIHIKSRKHKKIVSSLKKRAMNGSVRDKAVTLPLSHEEETANV